MTFLYEVIAKALLTSYPNFFRASNQSTEAASIAIVKFLEIENFEESSNGWMLLSALNLLAAGDPSLIQVKSFLHNKLKKISTNFNFDL